MELWFFKSVCTPWSYGFLKVFVHHGAMVFYLGRMGGWDRGDGTGTCIYLPIQFPLELFRTWAGGHTQVYSEASLPGIQI